MKAIWSPPRRLRDLGPFQITKRRRYRRAQRRPEKRLPCRSSPPSPPLWIFSWDYLCTLGLSGPVKKKRDRTSQRHGDPRDTSVPIKRLRLGCCSALLLREDAMHICRVLISTQPHHGDEVQETQRGVCVCVSAAAVVKATRS